MPDNAATSAQPVGRAHQPLRVVVCDEIRRRIINGLIPQGERILEDQLAQDLGVSRNPVREALQTLSHEGFVELEPRRGARVVVLSDDWAQQLFEVRAALEEVVATFAATRRTQGQLDAMRDIIAAGREAVRAARLDELAQLNTQFHTAMIDMAGNQLLAELLNDLMHRIEWVYTRRLRERGAWSWDEHGRIADAIAAADATTAAELAALHIRNARDAYFAWPVASAAGL